MNYTITFLETDHRALTEHLFSRPEERAAFLLCGISASDAEVRFLVREVVPVADAYVISSSDRHMSISSAAYVPLLKRADQERLALVFAHSHPPDYPHFSMQDDREETHLFQTIFNRVHHHGPHGSLIFSGPDSIQGRARLPSGEFRPIERIRIIGSRFRFIDLRRPIVSEVEVFDRQARAFGADLQPLLKSLDVGLVGVGGTGSAVYEQLIRLGLGKVTVIDQQNFEKSNINRVYGSGVADEGRPKVSIAAESAARIGLGTKVVPIARSLTFKSVAQELRDCDVVFGCTDDEWGRSILTALAVHYGIPVFDMGVSIDTTDGRIRSIVGRVTLLMPGNACLYCRNRITAARVSAETQHTLFPERAAELVKEGYIADLAEPAPAVIPFTSAVASFAITEFLNRLTGFMDAERRASEILYFFDQSIIRWNDTNSRQDCMCAPRSHWMKGDRPRFLNLNWRPE